MTRPILAALAGADVATIPPSTLKALVKHPLTDKGYASIGCEPCTTRGALGAGPRDGRWAGRDKTECGIHFIGGKVVRG